LKKGTKERITCGYLKGTITIVLTNISVLVPTSRTTIEILCYTTIRKSMRSEDIR